MLHTHSCLYRGQASKIIKIVSNFLENEESVCTQLKCNMHIPRPKWKGEWQININKLSFNFLFLFVRIIYFMCRPQKKARKENFLFLPSFLKIPKLGS